MSRTHTLIWTALLAAAPALLQDSGSSSAPTTSAREETQTPLFDNGLSSKNTIVASNPVTETASTTLEKWTKLALVTQSIAFQPQLLQQQVQQLPITSVDVPGGNPGNEQCSAANVPTQNGDCSVYVAPGSPPSNRDLCSAIQINPGGPGACSTNQGNPASITCSTQGGQTDPANPGNGTVACSAGQGGAGNGGTFTCSTTGATPQNQNQRCSTFNGQHQSCSTGNIAPGDSGQCSALNNAGAGFCSVRESTPPGSIGNKCSAINTVPGVSPNLTCSVTAGNNTARCSVLSNATGNGACTAITIHQGATEPQNNACSVLAGMGNNNRCSVINHLDGDIVTPPGANNRCGTFTSHEDLENQQNNGDIAP